MAKKTTQHEHTLPLQEEDPGRFMVYPNARSRRQPPCPGGRGQWRWVTPSLAQQWLDSMIKNRRLKPATLKRYAAEMSRRQWHCGTGQAICFDRRGDLVDGQHRLQALIRTGCCCWFFVMTDLEVDAFGWIDRLSPRNNADVLGIMGAERERQLAAAINKVVQLRLAIVQEVTNVRRTDMTGIEVHDYWMDKCQGLELCLATGRKIALQFGVSQAMLSALYYLCKEIDREDADIFYEQLADVPEPDRKSTLYLLWRRMDKLHRHREKWREIDLAVMVIKAWNAWRNGHKVSRLVHGVDPDNPVTLPMPTPE